MHVHRLHTAPQLPKFGRLDDRRGIGAMSCSTKEDTRTEGDAGVADVGTAWGTTSPRSRADSDPSWSGSSDAEAVSMEAAAGVLCAYSSGGSTEAGVVGLADARAVLTSGP
jgi:hypothetical protein